MDGGAVLTRGFMIALFTFVISLHGIAPLSIADDAGNGGAAVEGKADTEEEEVRLVTIRGKVLDDATGLPVSGAVVSSLGPTATTDSEGNFQLGNIPSSRTAVINFRITDDFGNIIGCANVGGEVSVSPVSAVMDEKVAVEVIETANDRENVVLRMVASNGTGINDFCMRCHKPNPCLLAPDTDWSKVTYLGGEAVNQKEFEEIKARILASGIDAETYPNLRYQDAHPQLVDILAVLNNGGKTAKGDFVPSQLLPITDNGIIVCDTCHTRHVPTEYQMFLRLDVVGEDMLCRQCHG